MMNENNTFLIINKTNLEVPYVINVCKDKNKNLHYNMFFSDSEIWSSSIRNEKILTIIDDGNGLMLSKKLKKRHTYCEIEELRVLLNFINKSESDIKYDFIKK